MVYECHRGSVSLRQPVCVGIVFASDIFPVCFVLPIMHFVPSGCAWAHILP